MSKIIKKMVSPSFSSLPKFFATNNVSANFFWMQSYFCAYFNFLLWELFFLRSQALKSNEMNRCMREEFSKCLKGNRELKVSPAPRENGYLLGCSKMEPVACVTMSIKRPPENKPGATLRKLLKSREDFAEASEVAKALCESFWTTREHFARAFGKQERTSQELLRWRRGLFKSFWSRGKDFAKVSEIAETLCKSFW